MKTLNTIAGNVYVITSRNGGTVTDSTGTLSKHVEAGDQLIVTAPSDLLLIDDDEAIMRPANFKRARLALRMLGAGEKMLPAGYTPLAFLQGTGKQYINVQTPADSSSEILCVFERLDETNKAVYSTTTNQTTAMLNCFVWGGNLSVLRFDWGTKNYNVRDKYNGGWVTSVQSANGVSLNGEQVITHAAQEPFSVSGLVLFTFSATANEWTANNVRMARWALKTNGKPVRDMVAVLSPSGSPCMYDRVTHAAFERSGSGQFIAGVKDIVQLRRVLDNLPTTGGTLTLSLPAEANTPEVAELLQACQERTGMTLTVYEYRPAAAVTYSLRRMRQVVWCRKMAAENGSYVDTENTRWHIARCAAIFGPLGNDPTAYGYEPFDSIEQAAEEWGLTPYEYPEEENLTTETE